MIDRTLSHYRIVENIGGGGMGEVYRARDERLERDVAVKVLPEAFANDRDRLARFEREARSASALNHPNIVTIYEIGQDNSTTYIAMELLRGKTLRETLHDGPLPLAELLRLATQVSGALAKAHAIGIVHRDLKPENLIILSTGLVKILDFGLAKLLEGHSSASQNDTQTTAPGRTRTGTFVGSPSYASPEQARALPVDFHAAGKRNEAQKITDELKEQANQDYVPAYHLALSYAGLGETDQAFKWLEKAYQERSRWTDYIAVDPRFDPLRSDLRFHSLLHRMNFPEK